MAEDKKKELKKAKHTQQKRVLTDKKENLRNSSKKSRVKTATKAFLQAVSENDKELAYERLNKCISLINRAKSDGVYKDNTASRKISTLTREYNSIK